MNYCLLCWSIVLYGFIILLQIPMFLLVEMQYLKTVILFNKSNQFFGHLSCQWNN